MSLQLGFFMVESGTILVCDPCYDDAPHMHITLPARNGKWWTTIERHGDRISRLYAVLDNSPVFLAPRNVGFAGVDSGQMGIYDKAHFNNPKSVEGELTKFEFGEHADWYLMCCNRTLGEVGAGLIPHGVVSSSGWGDGSYQVQAALCEGKAIYIDITFIEDEDEPSYEIEEDQLAW